MCCSPVRSGATCRAAIATLIRSIREQLWPLGRDVTFIPGHGPTSTFGEERESNPFVADRVLERARA